MRWFKLGLGLLAMVALVAFFLQNSARSTLLSFDVGVAAWTLASPISIPALMGVCFLSGVLVALTWSMAGRIALARRLRQLEQEAALRTPAAGSDPKGGWGG
ncbi:MAG: hypothetical protein EXR71_20115 [Myxococcales bacterium]|nr:hypothetical protein [Myxococcales bacterium]